MNIALNILPKCLLLSMTLWARGQYSNFTDEAAFEPRSAVAKAHVLFICPLLQPSCGHLFSFCLVLLPGCAFVEARTALFKPLFELDAWMPMLVKREEVTWTWETEKAPIPEDNRLIHLGSRLIFTEYSLDTWPYSYTLYHFGCLEGVERWGGGT